jgi:hypothetical protein
MVTNPSGAQVHIFITIRQLWIFLCRTSSLTRGRVCRLQLLLAFTSAVILVSEFHGTHDNIILFPVQNNRKWRIRCPYLYPTGTEGPIIHPGTGFHFRRLILLAGLQWRYSNPPPQGLIPQQFYYCITKLLARTA